MDDQEHRLEALSALAEPLRRRMFLFVAASRGPVSRDQTATAFEVARSVAAFHLDRLADAGLLEVEFRRPPGRGGPGAGRPAKWYRPAAEIAFSVPERHYEVAASIFGSALAAGGPETREALHEAARAYGRTIGSKVRREGRKTRHRRLEEIGAALADLGFEPQRRGSELVLTNCPFRLLAEANRELVCSMNLELVEGIVEELGDETVTPRLDPTDGRCCVLVACK